MNDLDHTGDFLFYTTPDGDLKIEAYYKDETVWLTQKAMAELFGVGVPAISKHLENIYESGELDKTATVSKMEIVRNEGERKVKRQVEFYSLDAIISVGYRVNSARATDFRRWATTVLRDFMIKGFALDGERLKNGAHFGKDYFDELLEQIRDIRASERRFYQKITDIYALSADYDSHGDITKKFFATVQNKLLFAITGQTAAELKVGRISAKKENMGLTTWKKSPGGKIMKSDVIPAKNVLTKDEIDGLNRIVSMYLDYAEDLARRGKVMYMKDWATRLNEFLKFNEREILQDAGRVSAEVAQKFAEEEYEKYRPIQDRAFESDFDREVKRIQMGKGKK
ncbi:virulence RhuM family protein [Candidatus Saccharibacteria bacterium]|nr:virulence RhuM family protein [Candidatus Saccharibacteria bacterium]